MQRILIKIVIAIIAVNLVNNVVISHIDEDIRLSIISSFSDKPKKELFKVYHFLFDKKYSLNSQEGIKRYKIFKNNLRLIKEMNSKLVSFKLGITDNTDLTVEEFRSTKLGEISSDMINSGFFMSYENETWINSDEINVPFEQTNIDWTLMMNPAKSQGICGSCWAFSSIGAIEGNYKIKFGKRLELSQQQLVDCNLTNKGCEGGSPFKAFNYIIERGIAYNSEYSYISGITNQRGVCKDQITKQNHVIKSYKQCPSRKYSPNIYMNLLSQGPLVVYMDGDGKSKSKSIFQHYTGGIIDASMTCSKINHAVVAVGYGKDEKGDFIIGRNSWGSSWGEKGNFRIRIRSSDKTCFMLDYALLPEVKETLNLVFPSTKPGCLKIYSECGLKGETKEICGNTTTIENKIQAGYELGKFLEAKIFFQYNNCIGSFLTLNSSSSCFETNGLTTLVNNIKSIIIDETLPPSGCVWLYDDHCLSGLKLEVCKDVIDLNDGKYNFGNKTSSIKLGPGIKGITIYLNKNYGGSNTIISKDIYGMSGSWMDKEIESIKIIK